MSWLRCRHSWLYVLAGFLCMLGLACGALSTDARAIANPFAQLADTTVACSSFPQATFFGFKTWYNNLQCGATGQSNQGQVVFQGLSDVWLVVFALVDDGVLLAGYLAVAFIIYGGVKYVLSQGNPSETAAALKTIIDATIGLVIAIMSVVIVNFVASRFNAS